MLKSIGEYVEATGACTVYQRRRPELTPLYRTVQANLETYLELARERHDIGGAVPPHVERAFRRYLECGILTHGFARARCGECGHDFLIAFSCKGRALCPACNARRMAETAAHLVDHVFPPLPVRQWVLSVPKRLRYFLQHRPEAISAVLHIVLRVIEARLRQASGCAHGRLGAVSFVQRFGSALNVHVHFHCCVIDGVFSAGGHGQVQFAEAGALTPEDLAAVQQQMRRRVLRWFARAGHLDAADARDMAGWNHGGGFSLDASVRIEGADRSGLERLLRYCARPPFALQRLEQTSDDKLVYRFDKPRPDGRTQLRLTPLELLDRLGSMSYPARGPALSGDRRQSDCCPVPTGCAVSYHHGIRRRPH